MVDIVDELDTQPAVLPLVSWTEAHAHLIALEGVDNPQKHLLVAGLERVEEPVLIECRTRQLLQIIEVGGHYPLLEIGEDRACIAGT